MKIKEVSKLTNLTDKAIRFYINNGLLNPSYTENYAGRKNYSFNENDVEVLKKIALLRSYSFSVSDIKRMLDDDSEICDVLENHICEMRINAAQNSFILHNLLNASITASVSLDDLCLALEEGKEVESKKEEPIDFRSTAKNYLRNIKPKISKILLISFSAVLTGIALITVIIITLTHLFMNMGGAI
ncbi:MAG: MerR family transcriptional regulator [Eubacterium sp.]|nr:MerR family transcriptional regulator [Eubacterium sp.]